MIKTSEVLPRNIAYLALELSWEFYDWGRMRAEMALGDSAIDRGPQLVVTPKFPTHNYIFGSFC